MKFDFVRDRDRQTQCGASQSHVWRRVIPDVGGGTQTSSLDAPAVVRPECLR